MRFGRLSPGPRQTWLWSEVFAHDNAASFEFGRAGQQARHKPGNLRRDAGQAIHAGRVQAAGAAEEITIERHVSHQAFLGQQMAARRDVPFPAAVLNLAEEMGGNHLAHRQPEIVADFGSLRPRVGDQRGHDGWVQRVAAALFELGREVGRPGEGPPGHRLQKPAHE
jgi:hypothetical protein